MSRRIRVGMATTMTDEHANRMRFIYQNHRNEVAIREVTPIRVEFRRSEWHEGQQWILVAYDHDRNGERDFAMIDIVRFLDA